MPADTVSDDTDPIEAAYLAGQKVLIDRLRAWLDREDISDDEPPSSNSDAPEPWQAEILVEWWPSASVGETAAVRKVLEGWCTRLMETLQAMGLVDPTVELSIDGQPSKDTP